MAEWIKTDTSGSRLKRWLHSPTGVELFVDRIGSERYGVFIRATDDGAVDRISIGDPKTGLFREFETETAAIEWTVEWKTETAMMELVPADDENT